jgi:hypothetical protein
VVLWKELAALAGATFTEGAFNIRIRPISTSQLQQASTRGNAIGNNAFYLKA